MKSIIILILLLISSVNILSQDVAILYPTPNTKLFPSELIDIRWSNPQSQSIALYYRLDNSPWELIVEGITGESYSWEIPQSTAIKISFLVKYSDIKTPILYWHQPDAHSYELSTGSFTPSGNYILTGSRDDSNVKLWDFVTHAIVRQADLSIFGELYYTIPYSDDKSFAAVGDYLVTVDFSQTPIIGKVINIGSQVRAIQVTQQNGGMVAATSLEGKVFIFDSDLNYVKEFSTTGQNFEIYTVAFSQDGNMVCFSSYDGVSDCYDLNNDNLLFTKSGHGSAGVNTLVWSVDIAPNKSTIATSGTDGTVRVWSTSQDDAIKIFSKHTRHVRSVRYSPDGELLVSGSLDGYLRLYDPNGLSEYEKVAINHGSDIFSTYFRNDGDYVISSGRGKDFKVWRVYKPRPYDDSVECGIFREVSIYIPHLTVGLNENFSIPVISDYNKSGLVFAKNIYKLDLEIEFPILLVDVDLLSNLRTYVSLDTLNISVDFDISSDTVLNMQAFSLLGPTNYGEIKLLSVKNDGGLELLTKDGSVTILKECPGEYDRGVLIDGSIPSISSIPNPAQNHLTINADIIETGDYRIEMLDNAGRNVLEAKNVHLHSGINTIDFNTISVANGSYFIRLVGSNTILTDHIIINK